MALDSGFRRNDEGLDTMNRAPTKNHPCQGKGAGAGGEVGRLGQELQDGNGDGDGGHDQATEPEQQPHLRVFDLTL